MRLLSAPPRISVSVSCVHIKISRDIVGFSLKNSGSQHLTVSTSPPTCWHTCGPRSDVLYPTSDGNTPCISVIDTWRGTPDIHSKNKALRFVCVLFYTRWLR